jgi:hypothetical protein
MCSSPNEVTEIFNLPNPSSRNMALGLNQLLTEMNTRTFFWEEKCGWHVSADNHTICVLIV